MSLIRTLWQCAFSPRLYKFHEISWKTYEAQGLEKWGDQVVVSLATAWSFTIYAIPLILIAMFRRGSPLSDAYTITQFVTGAGIILVTSLAARGYSRSKNPTYLKFMKVLDDAKSHYTYETKQELGKYDFEFWAWPVDFDERSIEKRRDKLTLKSIDMNNRNLSSRGRDSILAVPCKVLSYSVAHTIAVKLIYPGSSTILNYLISGSLRQGRIELFESGAERFKLLTSDNNEIDTIFIDQRHKTSHGSILVITCEGNCGFYEVGIINTPKNKGYSILGWNHPGFGGSTGLPYPEQEENAMDCVMKFAIHKLGFPANKIILNGWSIGGYTASWAAMNYPSVHSVLLDATFDDLLPLAVDKMPSIIDPLVRTIVRNHFNLNVSAQINRYDGRVLIVRRTDDEMICVPDGDLGGNRGNKLLEKLLARRYPNLFTNSNYLILSQYLEATTYNEKRAILQNAGVDQNRCRKLIAEDIIENNSTVKYPSSLGWDCDIKTKQQLILYLATLYMEDQNGQHCVPLAPELFHSGWDPMSTIKEK